MSDALFTQAELSPTLMVYGPGKLVRPLADIEGDEPIRRCSACGLVKTLTEFYETRTARTCKRCQSSQAAQWNSDNPDRYRAAHLQRTFKMTPEQYEQRLAKQGGVCAMCGEPPGERLLVIDHDHACCPGRNSCGDCVRGLICHRCNVVVGQANDDVPLLRKAIRYLEDYTRVVKPECFHE